MITYTFLIGYGYVEDSRGTHAIVNFWTEETNPKKAVEEFIKTLKGCFSSNEKIQNFLRNYFDWSADDLGPLGDLELIQNWNWWGSIKSGPLINLEGLNHFFDDPEEDDYHLSRCCFTFLGSAAVIDIDEKNLNEEEIYKKTIGSDENDSYMYNI